MPTRVKSHTAHRGSVRYRVRAYIRMGPEHTAAFRRRVAAIQRSGGAANAYSVATRQFEREGRKIFTRTRRK